jgi:signal transduction histidine kinase
MPDRRARIRLFDYLLERPMPLAATLAVLVAVIEAAIDWATWVELDVSAVYGIPLVLAAVARNRRLLWVLTACLVFMAFAAYATQIDAGTFALDEPYFVNRVLSAGALSLTAALCHVWIVAANRLAAQRRSLIEQNQELERLRRSAEEASGRKTQLLAAVSHDIRTPLTTIDLIADLILRSGANPGLGKQLPEMVQRLRHNTRSLADLVSALGDISALDAGQIPLRAGEFSLNELLAQERERLLPLAQAKGLRLALEAPQPAIWLHTDRVKLVRIIGNLVGNAIKFTHAGGVTLAAAATPERAVVIRVSDTGAGMSAENLERIFEEYGQLGNRERDSSMGWGLGLAICRRLAGVMGGQIAVESTPGHGTTFSLYLPASCVVKLSPQPQLCITLGLS